MHEAMKTALEKAQQNSAKMVALGTKESYEDPYHRNQLKRGGVAKKPMKNHTKKK